MIPGVEGNPKHTERLGRLIAEVESGEATAMHAADLAAGCRRLIEENHRLRIALGRALKALEDGDVDDTDTDDDA